MNETALRAAYRDAAREKSAVSPNTGVGVTEDIAGEVQTKDL